MTWEVIQGDCLETLRGMADNSVDSCVTDPPYGLGKPPDMHEVLTAWLAGEPWKAKGRGFMGKEWDAFVPGPEVWREVLRVLKPGAHALVFAGSRTVDVMGLSLRLAGFEIRDQLQWLHGQGFPKGLNITNQLLQAEICQSTESAPRAVQTSKSIQVRSSVGKEPIAAALVQILPGDDLALLTVTGAEVALCALTDTLRSELLTATGLSTTSLSSESLADASKEASRSITSTACEMITDEKTWSWLTGLHTSGNTTPVSEILNDGERWPVIYAGPDLNAGSANSMRIRIVTALGDATWNPVKNSEGWNVALKPAHEPIILARKPFPGTLAANFTEWGTGAVNVDGCRIDHSGRRSPCGADGAVHRSQGNVYGKQTTSEGFNCNLGRWPANLILDEEAGAILDAQAGNRPGMKSGGKHRPDATLGMFGAIDSTETARGDNGGPSRFFYTAKSSKRERNAGLIGANGHPTVKPIDLMRWLCRLITPVGGLVLDPFTGSGSTGCAATLEGFRFVGCELSDEYTAIARARIAHWSEMAA
jgi:DNA modification methylase